MSTREAGTLPPSLSLDLACGSLTGLRPRHRRRDPSPSPTPRIRACGIGRRHHRTRRSAYAQMSRSGHNEPQTGCSAVARDAAPASGGVAPVLARVPMAEQRCSRGVSEIAPGLKKSAPLVPRPLHPHTHAPDQRHCRAALPRSLLGQCLHTALAASHACGRRRLPPQLRLHTPWPLLHLVLACLVLGCLAAPPRRVGVHRAVPRGR